MYVDTQAYIDDHTTEAKRLINTAHDILKRYGWVQGSYETLRGHCLVGALQAAADNLDGPIELRAIQLLGAAVGVPKSMTDRLAIIHRIETWNDDPDRSKRQVLAVMKKAAK